MLYVGAPHSLIVSVGFSIVFTATRKAVHLWSHVALVVFPLG